MVELCHQPGPTTMQNCIAAAASWCRCELVFRKVASKLESIIISLCVISFLTTKPPLLGLSNQLTLLLTFEEYITQIGV